MSKNINVAFIVNGDFYGDGTAGGKIPHTQVDPSCLAAAKLEDLPLLPECQICAAAGSPGRVNCLTNLASGQAMVEQMKLVLKAGKDSKVIAEMQKRTNEKKSAIYDAGGVSSIAAPQGTQVKKIDARAIVDAANTGTDDPALTIVRRAGVALGCVIADEVIPNFRPDIVVIGGVAARSLPLIEAVRETVRAKSKENVDIEPSGFQGLTALFGAAIQARPTHNPQDSTLNSDE